MQCWQCSGRIANMFHYMTDDVDIVSADDDDDDVHCLHGVHEA